MAKARGVEGRLSRLRALRHENVTPELVAELRRALADASSLVVAAAAEIAGARMLVELMPELAAAFDRFMVEPAASDKLCRAKTAIVEALHRMEYEGEELFRRGVQHVQMEAAWGGETDTAANMRANCAFALTRIRVPDLLVLLADLLLDKEVVVRRAAVEALGASGMMAALPLLRYKTRSGDKDGSVTAECLAALMSLAPVESLPLVREYLHRRDAALQEGAAFALGESRRPDALQVLLEHWPRARGGDLQEALLLAIAMTRLPAGLDFLIGLIREPQPIALAALAALRIHRHQEALRQRVAAAVEQTGDAILAARFQQKFKADA